MPLADIIGVGNSGKVPCTLGDPRLRLLQRVLRQCGCKGGRGAAGPAEIAWLGWALAAARLSSPILRPSRHSGLCMVDYRLRRAGDDPRPTHPPQGKNHSSVQLLDAPCYGSIKPSSLAPLTSKLFPPIFLDRHLRPSFSTTIADIVTTFPINPDTCRGPPFSLLVPITVVLPVLPFSTFNFQVPP